MGEVLPADREKKALEVRLRLTKTLRPYTTIIEVQGMLKDLLTILTPQEVHQGFFPDIIHQKGLAGVSL